jgi:phosphoglycolate phosphatase
VLEAAKRLGVSPKECVVVGDSDSPLDVEAGRRAGSLTVAVLSDPASRKQLENAKPTVIVEDIGAIQDMLFKKNLSLNSACNQSATKRTP